MDKKTNLDIIIFIAEAEARLLLAGSPSLTLAGAPSRSRENGFSRFTFLVDWQSKLGNQTTCPTISIVVTDEMIKRWQGSFSRNPDGSIYDILLSREAK